MSDAPRAVDTALSLVPSRDELELVKRTVAQGATDAELKLFLHDCQRQGVHPLDRLLHFTKRGGKYTPITSIDLMRTRAAESAEYAGSDDPRFTYPAGAGAVPETATVTVWRLVGGQRFPFTATARWAEYKPADGQDVMWRRMPHNQLGKCAEALALRKAFPRQLAGLYAREELAATDDTSEPDATAWAAEPPSQVGETLRAALRATPSPPKPEPEPAPARVVDDVPPLPLPPQTVTITAIDTARPGSKARGFVKHSGGVESIPFYTEQVERDAKAAHTMGVPIVLEIGQSKSHQPYVKAIKPAPGPVSVDDIPF